MEELKSSIELNGRAMENMPYDLIKDIDNIEYQLTISEISYQEGVGVINGDVLDAIYLWLDKVPV